MSGSRERILEGIRRSLGQQAASQADHHAPTPRQRQRPHRVAVGEETVQHFVAKLAAAAATATRVSSLAEVGGAVVSYLGNLGFPLHLVPAPDPDLEGIRWPDNVSVGRCTPRGEDRVALVKAFAGIAETGSIVMISCPQSPTALNFLAEAHIAVLPHSRIVKYIEDAWHLVDSELGCLPRAINVITGPSRTADIEQTLQLGAHGPRQLHVVLVETWPA